MQDDLTLAYEALGTHLMTLRTFRMEWIFK